MKNQVKKNDFCTVIFLGKKSLPSHTVFEIRVKYYFEVRKECSAKAVGNKELYTRLRR